MDHLSWDDVWACLDRERTANGSTFAHLHLCGECSERWNKARSIHESLVAAFTESVPKPSEDAINRLFTTLGPTSATPCPAIVTPPAEAVDAPDLGGHCRSSSSDCRKAWIARHKPHGECEQCVQYCRDGRG